MTSAFARALMLTAPMLLAACTFINKATFSIEPQEEVARDEVLRGLEASFQDLGFQIQRKTDFLYPDSRKEATYFLGHRELPFALQSTYRHAALRLERSGVLYVDWVEISDYRRELKPDDFARLHAKIAADLKARLAVDVVFRLVPAAVTTKPGS